METTYIFGRIWRRLPPEVDSSIFDDVPDEDLQGVLDGIAARWILTDGNSSPDDPLGAWAVSVLETAKSAPPALNANAAHQLALHACAELVRGEEPMRAPRWVAFHVEPSREMAEQVVQSLVSAQGPHSVLRCKLEGESGLPLLRRVELERHIEALDDRLAVRIRDGLVPGEISVGDFGWIDWMRLRAETQKLSSILSRLAPTAPVNTGRSGRTPGGASTGDVPLLDDADAQQRFKQECSPGEQAAFREFLEACTNHNLEGARPTEAHWTKAGKPGKNYDTWRKQVSEALRKTSGPAKVRRIEATRSMVERSKLDSRE